MGIPVDSTKSVPLHPSEEILEEYAFGRLSEALSAQVEEHLLICHTCQDTVAETDRFASELKAATRLPDPSAPAVAPVPSGWRNALDSLPRLGSRSSLAPLLVLGILALLMIRPSFQQPPTPVSVSLSSLRGFDPLSRAPAGKPLQLRIEAPDLGAGKEYRVELVDADGGQVWKGAVMETDGKLVAAMSKPLGTGVYWVRLYGAHSELLREFGLSVK